MSESSTSSTNAPLGLNSLGWHAGISAELTVTDAQLLPARVTRVERGGCMVAMADGEHLANPTLPVAVGDWVGIRQRHDALLVEARTERSSQLTRRDPQGRIQVLAANIDIVFVTAPADRLSAARIERETAMAWDSGAQPVVLVTKLDLAAPGAVTELADRLIGVDIIATSTVSGDGVDQVAAMLAPARTAVLLGPSGAGKSSLVNQLLGDERLAVGGVRDGDRRGRHTTTSRQLVAVPGGGVLIDTPGLRSLSLAGGHDGVASAFADIEQLAEACRFADCRHEQEPHCAVLAAVEAGALDARRVANYHKLLREIDFQSRRDDPLARAEAERVWKIRSKAAKQLFKERGRR